MRFLVDTSLSPRMASGLVEAGHAAVHVRDLGMGAAVDDAVFAEAARDRRILLAQDVDFGTILARRRERSPSVMNFRCRLKSVDRLLPILLRTLVIVKADLESGSIVVVEDSRIRIRRLPI